MSDVVNHPPHYTAHPSGVECIQITEHMGFNLGNAIKYIWRADEKGQPLRDLEKAAWYVNREIERREHMALAEDMDQLWSVTEQGEAFFDNLMEDLRERLDEPVSNSADIAWTAAAGDIIFSTGVVDDTFDLPDLGDEEDEPEDDDGWAPGPADGLIVEDEADGNAITFRLGEFLPDVSLSISRAAS